LGACSYNEAHKIKLKADALEAWELEKGKNQKQQEMLQREVVFKQRQRQDLDALLKRIQSGREEQKKQRQVDLERYVIILFTVGAIRRLTLFVCTLQPAAAVPERQGRAPAATQPRAHPVRKGFAATRRRQRRANGTRVVWSTTDLENGRIPLYQTLSFCCGPHTRTHIMSALEPALHCPQSCLYYRKR
jgi:hypothetical protein